MRSKNKFIQTIFTAVVLLTVVLSSFQTPFAASAQGERGDGIVRDYNTETGKVTMISGENNEPITILSAMEARMSSRQRADVLVQTFATEFGVANPVSDLHMMEQDQSSENRVTTRYQQTYNDVPVIAGELIVNANDQGALSSMSGEVAQGLSLETNPSLTADQAVEIAKQGMVKWHGGSPADYIHTEAVLSILDEKLLRPSIRPAELVWKIEMVPTNQSQPIREFVVVNAKTGNIPLHFNQIDTAWHGANAEAGVNQPPQQEEITPTPIATEIPVIVTPVPTEMPLPTETPIPTEASLPTDASPLPDTSASDVDTFAVTLYVKASGGSDANTCLSVAMACATINGAIGKAAPSGDTIKVETGTYIGTGTEVVLINKSVKLSGGWNAEFTTQSSMTTIDGQSARLGALVNPEISAMIERFVVQNGLADYNGGGIANAGTLVLNNSLIQNNTCCSNVTGGSSNGGGGIGNFGVLTVNNSTIRGNHAYLVRGSSYQGGGLFNYNGTLTLNNSTVSGNEAGAGGGLFSFSTVVLNNSTVSGNRAVYGGGIDFYNDFIGTFTFTIRNTLVADNLAENNGIDCYGPISSTGYNLIGDNSGCSFSANTGDLVGTSAGPINPLLNSLQDNGGLTFTHALGIGSPAINAGNPAAPGSGGNACLATDQRGTTRPVDSRCDIGAYEGSVTFVPSPRVDTYTANGSPSLPGALLCNEFQLDCTNGNNLDADAAHKYAIGTYSLYLTQFNRDSIDNNGMTITSTVHYCDPTECPYDNAFWDGAQMVYGEGYSLADDVVAHELTHGVTEYESNLFYFYQSGAINESLSDVFGEYSDQTNGLGNDTPSVKWLHGEDLPGGAYRDMSNPPEFSDPDKMSSALFVKTDVDNGGVHSNSGVNNKAVYLIVDGGTFNNFTMAGIGWEKTAAIYYEAQTNLLASGADYSDLYYAVQQACANLSLTNYKSITSADCIQVKKALDAVEMNSQPDPNFSGDAVVCIAGTSTGAVGSNLFTDNFENGTSKWTLDNNWSLEDFYAASPTHMMYGDDYLGDSTSILQMKNPVTLPAGISYLYFKHAYAFENDGTTYYDGGVLEYSINNGGTWVDANTLFSSGQNYNGSVYEQAGSSSTLQGRLGFVGDSHGYTSTRYTLTSLAGKNVKFRWVFSTDQFYGYLGWVLDDVKIYSCVGSPSVPSYVSPAKNALVTDYTPLLDWSNATPNIHHYEIQIATDNTFAPTSLVYDVTDLLTSQYIVPTDLNPNTTYYWRVRAFNALDETKGWTIARTFRTALRPPTLTTPTMGTPLLTNRPIFDWGDVAGATSYTIQAAPVNTFSGTLTLNATATSSIYTAIKDLPAKKTIYWRVRSNGTNGPSVWSSVFSLTTANTPSIPALVAPTENLLISTTLTPKLDWGKSTVPAGVTLDHYHIQVATDAAFSTIVTQTAVTGILPADFSDYIVPTLAPNTKYYWRVRSFNTADQYSSWSLTRSFRIALPAPALTLPASSTPLFTNRPTFDWEDVTGATGYTIQAATVSTFAGTLTLNAATTSSTYTAIKDLPANKTIYWRVRSNGTNGPSAWSAVFTLTTANAPSIPVLVAPTENLLISTTLTPKLDWGKSTVPTGVTLDHYHLQVATDAAFSTIVTQADITGILPADFSSYIVSTLLPNTKYYWRVNSFNAVGQYSSWSLTRSFRTAILPPALTTPNGPTGSLNLKPPFDWMDVVGASNYTIQVSKVSTFSSLLVSVTAASSAYTPIVNLPANTTLYWRVRTNGANGPSNWSAPSSFIIQ